MRIQFKLVRFSTLVFTLLAGILGVMVGTASAQISGAIFTTNSAGARVNGNLYSTQADVYLNGGPQPNALCTSAGLPDGDYYFQVTNPSSSVLLSADVVKERRVRIFNGLITNYSGTTHAIGAAKCPGGISVALAPFGITPNPGAEYKAWMVPVTAVTFLDGLDESTSWQIGFSSSDAKTDNFKVRPPGCWDPSCVPELEIGGHKFYDTNTNGKLEPGEPVIDGWRIEKAPPSPPDVTYTVNGEFEFYALAGTYTISEVFPGLVPQVWLPTTSTSNSVTVTSSTPYTDAPDFGNVCIGAGGGLTLGFWSNPNGQKLCTSSDLAVLSAMNLRNADGSNFDPANYTAFRSWILSANAVNMANMLSAQLAAMVLNVLHGFVNSNALIFAPGAASANSAGFTTVNALISEANVSLGANGCSPDPSSTKPPCATPPNAGALRTYQAALKNALDGANNNRNFVLSPPLNGIPPVCAFTTPY
jgi:hypothetical protein